MRQKDDGKRKSTKPPSDHEDEVPASPPMSPVICPSQQHLRALKEVSGHKTSTPNAAGVIFIIHSCAYKNLDNFKKVSWLLTEPKQ